MADEGLSEFNPSSAPSVLPSIIENAAYDEDNDDSVQEENQREVCNFVISIHVLTNSSANSKQRQF